MSSSLRNVFVKFTPSKNDFVKTDLMQQQCAANNHLLNKSQFISV